MKKIYTFFAFLFTGLTGAQNLVPNPSLDLNNGCPGQISQIYTCQNWTTTTTNNINFSGTPDYFHTCATSTVVGVPGNNKGWQYPHGGTAYAGIVLVNLGNPSFREYIETQLISPLVANAVYDFEMYISLADKSEYTTDDIQVYFSNTIISGVNNWDTIAVNAQLENTTGNRPDTATWIKVSGSYNAQGGEQYIVIGNFKGASRTDYVFVNGNNSFLSYVYIDDVSLVMSTTSILSEKDKPLSFSPNPSTGVFFINGKMPAENAVLKVFNAFGQVVYHSPIKDETTRLDLSAYPKGIYFAVITSEKYKWTGKLIID